MSHQPMSSQIEAAIAALEANPNSTPDQLAELRRVHLEMLRQVRDFAVDFEAARARNDRCIPLWGGAGAAARFYRWLEIGRRRPIAGMGESLVTINGRVA